MNLWGNSKSHTLFFTYAKNSINEWIVTAIRHGKPMAAEKYDIDVPITEKKTIFDVKFYH